jgi:hypothetical protein
VIVRFLVSVGLAVGPCLALACSPFIEEHPTSSSASFRPHTTAFEHCTVETSWGRGVFTGAIRPVDWGIHVC